MRFSCALLMMSLATVASAAQQPVPPSAPTPGQKPAPAAEAQPVTVLTGCLRSSGADTAVAGPSGRIYTLEVVEPPAKSSTTPSTATNPPVATKTTYSLAAAESLGLAKHVDHEVQLTGKLQAPSTAATPPAPGPGTDRKPTAGGGHRTFEVTALKMIANKCSS
jgi:hypothetical protein